MAKKRGSFGKILVGAALIGAAAYGVYRLLDGRRREKEEADRSMDETAARAKASQAAEDVSDNQAAAAAGEGGHYASVDLRQKADRAYTTIQHGSREAADRMREAVGPKGEEVILTVGDAAGEVGRTVAESAAKILDILREEPEAPEAEPASFEEMPAAGAASFEETPASEKSVPGAEETGENFEAFADAAPADGPEKTPDVPEVEEASAAAEVSEEGDPAPAQEPVVDAPPAEDAGSAVEEFFDDEE